MVNFLKEIIKGSFGDISNGVRSQFKTDIKNFNFFSQRSSWELIKNKKINVFCFYQIPDKKKLMKKSKINSKSSVYHLVGTETGSDIGHRSL